MFIYKSVSFQTLIICAEFYKSRLYLQYLFQLPTYFSIFPLSELTTLEIWEISRKVHLNPQMIQTGQLFYCNKAHCCRFQ